MRAVVRTVLAAAVASGGALPTISYPPGFSKGSFTLSRRHIISHGGVRLRAPQDFSVSFGDAAATITLASGVTLPAGADLRIEFDSFGDEDGDIVLRGYGKNLTNAAVVKPVLVNLGNPVVADRDGICAAQVRTGAGVLVINGAGVGVANGVWTADFRRNVTVYSAADLSALTFTIKGTWNGVPITRTITGPNATTVATTATFDTVTEVSVSATIGINVEIGFGEVLGSPVRIPSTRCVLAEFQDGAAPTAGTVVAGVNVSTTTAGDPFGTYDPNAACNGTLTFHLLLVTTDPSESGPVQFPNTTFPLDA